MPLGDNNTDIYILIDYQGYSNHAKSEIQISRVSSYQLITGDVLTLRLQLLQAAAHGRVLILVSLYKDLRE